MIENITPESIASWILLLPDDHEGPILIFEGSSDIRLYSKFIDRDKCRVINAFNKNNALRAIELLEEKHFIGVIAIVDADFWSIDGYKHPSLNVFRTDTHDLETMIIRSSAFGHLLIEYGSEKKIKTFCKKFRSGVKESIIQISVPIGCLRFLSKDNSLNLRFESIKFNDFLRASKELSIDIKQLVISVLNHSQRHDINKSNLLITVQDEVKKGYDSWQISNGHDIIEILSFALRNLIGTNNANDVKTDTLEKSLRLAYEFIHFRETQLYSSLTEWEVRNDRMFLRHYL